MVAKVLGYYAGLFVLLTAGATCIGITILLYLPDGYVASDFFGFGASFLYYFRKQLKKGKLYSISLTGGD